MTIRELIKIINSDRTVTLDTPITCVTSDSRTVQSGAVFFACPGEHVDGHMFAQDAVKNGAVLIVGERKDVTDVGGVPYVTVPNVRIALGIVAHALVGYPTEKLTVIGVTGTNGKTSTTLMIRHILQHAGAQAACFGTLGYFIADEQFPTQHTTPFAEELAMRFKGALDAGVTHVVMEVSSHALEQERIAGIKFRVGVFTNLTQDHLDYHKNMESYRKAKLKLFQRLEGENVFAVINLDDPSAKMFMENTRVPIITFGEKGDCQAKQIRITEHVMSFQVDTPWGRSPISLNLLGKHNVANALAALATCANLGIPLETIAAALKTIKSVPGRFEHISEGQPFYVIVDYAHTEDGLRNVLLTAREICRKRIILVFGCGGDRDKGKRPKMGRVAAELADFSIVTSDNPRTEPPERILLDIEVGLQHMGKRRDTDYVLLLDRKEAIRTALHMAKEGDLVLIAGKGHENYQIIGTQRLHFDDREVARNILKDMIRSKIK